MKKTKELNKDKEEEGERVQRGQRYKKLWRRGRGTGGRNRE